MCDRQCQHPPRVRRLRELLYLRRGRERRDRQQPELQRESVNPAYAKLQPEQQINRDVAGRPPPQHREVLGLGAMLGLGVMLSTGLMLSTGVMLSHTVMLSATG